MINPSLIEFSTFFFQSKLLIHCIFFKTYDVVSVADLFFIGLFFIFRMKSVVCKKYTNTGGKDSKSTNAIDII